MKAKQLTGAFVVITAALLAIGLWGGSVYANPDYLDRVQTSTTGSSTLAYMTAGTGTTTLELINTQASAYKSAVGLVQVTATSTGVAGQVLLDARIEGSMDTGTTRDWYPIAIGANTTLGTTPSSATTTLLTSPYNVNRLALSTTTIGYAGNFGGTGTATVMLSSFEIPANTRHIRVIFTDPAGGGKYGLYAEIVAKRESN